MANYNPYNMPPAPGLGNVGSYQVSGMPYITGSMDATAQGGVRIEFPSVTSWVVVSNADGDDNDLTIAFSQNGLGTAVGGVTGDTQQSGSFTMTSGQITPRLELKITELYLSGSGNCSVIAGLTGISATRVNNSAISPSGTNWSGSTAAVVNG